MEFTRKFDHKSHTVVGAVGVTHSRLELVIAGTDDVEELVCAVFILGMSIGEQQ